MASAISSSPAITLLVCVLSLGLILAVTPGWAEQASEPAPEDTQSQEQAPADPEAPIIEYSRDPNTVVIMMTWGPGGMAHRSATPLLRIYGNGQIDVRGRWKSQLTEKEMSDLLVSLWAKGVMDFDAEAADRQIREIEAQRRREAEEKGLPYPLRGASDYAPTIIELHLEAYRPARTHDPTTRPLQKGICRPHIQMEAREFPEIGALTGLAAAHRELTDIVQRSRCKGQKNMEGN